MANSTCQQCSKLFYVKPNRVLKGWGKYCSNACKHASFRKGIIVACSSCGIQTNRDMKSQKRSKSGKFFCSKNCQTVWRNTTLYVREGHSNWTGGKSSYRSVMLRDQRAKTCVKCNLSDPRVLAVHHRDKNRDNNDLTNLIWLCHNCHYLVHHDKQESVGYLV